MMRILKILGILRMLRIPEDAEDSEDGEDPENSDSGFPGDSGRAANSVSLRGACFSRDSQNPQPPSNSSDHSHRKTTIRTAEEDKRSVHE